MPGFSFADVFQAPPAYITMTLMLLALMGLVPLSLLGAALYLRRHVNAYARGVATGAWTWLPPDRLERLLSGVPPICGAWSRARYVERAVERAEQQAELQGSPSEEMAPPVLYDVHMG